MRLTRLTLLLIAIILLLGFYQLSRFLTQEAEPQVLQATEEVMVDVAHILSELVEKEMISGDWKKENLKAVFDNVRTHQFEAKIFDLTKNDVGIHFYVADKNGIIIFDSDNGKREGKDYSKKYDVHYGLKGIYHARSTREDEEDSTSSIMYVPAIIGDHRAPIGVLTIYKKQLDAFPMIASQRDSIRRSIWIIGIGILLLIAAVFAWVYRPIGVLTEYANAVEKGARPAKPKLGAGKEVNTLFHALETMRESLEGRHQVERYTRTMTHEMKSPLAAIRGAAELLQEEMPEKNRIRFLQNIHSETIRAERLINRLLELSAVESRTHLEKTEELDMCEIIQRALSQAYAIAELANVQLHAHLPSTPVTIRGDSYILRAAVTNLLENAIDFSSAGGNIIIDLETRNQEAILTIDDNGPGVPDYALEKVFEKFYSLRHHQSGRKGTGLGLNLVKEAAELHGGRVSLTNLPSSGARATLILPISQAKI